VLSWVLFWVQFWVLFYIARHEWKLEWKLNGNWLGHQVACTNWIHMISNIKPCIGQMLAVTMLNIKQAPIERKPV